MPKSRSKKKDPNKPKGVKSAYIFFTENVKKESEGKGEELSFIELSKVCGAKWKDMDEDDKAPYVKLSEKDRKRHEKEMEHYNPPSDSDSDDERPKKKTKKEKDPNAPKKNVTAYFHFAAAKRPEIKASDPDLRVTDVAKKIGEMWQTLSADEKQTYEQIAQKDKARYQKEFAEYTKSK